MRNKFQNSFQRLGVYKGTTQLNSLLKAGRVLVKVKGEMISSIFKTKKKKKGRKKEKKKTIQMGVDVSKELLNIRLASEPSSLFSPLILFSHLCCMDLSF